MNLLKPLIAAFFLVASLAHAQTAAYLPGGHDSTSLDLYSFEGAQNAPVMVYVHGGAWIAGDKSRVHRKDDFFNNRGYVFISVNYTLVPQTTVERQLEEIDAALGYIVANVARFGGDPNNISLMGHSAGAHLVAMTALRPLENAQALISSGGLRAVISNDTRAYNIPRIAADAGGQLPSAYARPFGSDAARWAALSPLTYIGETEKNLPPFLITHSGQGNSIRRASYAVEFADALRVAGISATVYEGSQYSHEEINKGIGSKPGITGAIAAFLDSVQ